jgi:hypothetical protein
LQPALKRSHVVPPSAVAAAPFLETLRQTTTTTKTKTKNNNNNQNLDPQNPPLRVRVRPASNNDEDPAKRVKNVGLTSSEEDRVEKDAAWELRARKDKKRRVGVPATTLELHAIPTAVEACGRGADTVHCPGRPESSPRRAVSMVDVNEVEEKPAHGGKLKPGEIRRLKTVVTAFGYTDDSDLEWILNKLIISMKYENGQSGHIPHLN